MIRFIGLADHYEDCHEGAGDWSDRRDGPAGDSLTPGTRPRRDGLARRPEAVAKDAQSDKLRVVAGEARDAGSLNGPSRVRTPCWWRLVRSFKKDDLHEALMHNLIAAMKKHGVRRIVNLSAWGVNNKQAVMSSFFFEYFFRPVFLKNIWADKSAPKRCSRRAGSFL